MKFPYIHLLCAGVLALTATGCNDFLDQPIAGNSTDENFYDTQYKLQSALNATYDILQSDAMIDTDWRFGEACADNVNGSDEGMGSDMGQLVNFRFNPSNTLIKNRWEIYYKGVHRVNQVIANIHRCRMADTQYKTYKAVREILGQAKFLRAYFYFNLVKTFGGVPIRPEVEKVDSLVVPRSSKEECYAYIEKDLREAIVALPNRYTATESGKASAGAAAALLMKVLMYESTPGTPSESWKECARIGEYFVKGAPMTMAQMLHYPERYAEGLDWETLRQQLFFKPQELCISSDPYEGPDFDCPKLSSAYSLQFEDQYGEPLTYDGQWYSGGEFCKSSIFEVVFKESADGTTGDTNEGTGIYSTLFSNTSPMWVTDEIISTIFGNDPRKAVMIAHHQFTPDQENTELGGSRWQPLKWYTPIKDRPIYTGDSGKNRRVLRFPEVVLTYAEALNECSRGADALEQLNSYKQIVNKLNNSTTLYVGGGYGYMRDQIWADRQIEMCYEWDRLWDIIRQGRAQDVLSTFASKRSNHRGGYFRKGVNEVFPIPQTEIDLSNGVVKQNPGY